MTADQAVSGRAATPSPGGRTDITAPWMHTADEMVEQLDTDETAGLSHTEANRRRKEVGLNELEATAPRSTWTKLAAQFKEPLVILLLVATIISFVAWAVDGDGSFPVDAVVIIVIVIANAALGLWQEQRAQQAVAALQTMTQTHSRVIRDGEQQSVASNALVPGDILVLGEGDAVGADARLIQAAALTVAEAPLTGESEPVAKQTDPLLESPIGDRTNMVFNGTAVVSGRGSAVVTATAMNTEMGHIATLLDEQPAQRTPLQREIDRVGKLLGVGVAVLAVVVAVAILLTSEISDAADFVDVLLIGVALAVAAVPEGLPAILSVVLALGVQRMASENALVKKLSSVETLGSASVICTDKTGTLTRNEMTITTVVAPSGTVELTGVGYEPVGRALVDGSNLSEGPLYEEVGLILGAGSLANDADLHTDDGAWTTIGDPTEIAFLVAEEKLGWGTERRRRFERIGEIPFSSERKMMTTLNTDSDGTDLVMVTKGAPDVLIERCDEEREGNEVVALTPSRRAEMLERVDQLADAALRTLAVAYRPVSVGATSSAEPLDESIEQDLVLLGIVGMIDPPRSEVKAAIADAHGAGIRVVAITGDHPRTAQRITEDLGITESGESGLSGTELDRLSDTDFDRAVHHVSVFSRVAPEHKLRIVTSLQAQGEIVAMTGDGVNDAPALRRADIGVAMGIAGTEVSREAADMILADDDFTTIVTGVREGRAIFANISKFLRYLLASNAGEVLAMFFGIVGASVIGLSATDGELAVPLLATQILWINLLTDTGLALALGVDPSVDDPMTRPPRKLTDRIIDRPMITTIALTGVVLAAAGLIAFDLENVGGLLGGSGDITSARTHVFTTLVLGNILAAFNARSDMASAFTDVFANRWLWLAAGTTVALQVAVVHLPQLNGAFDTTPMSVQDWLTCAALASLVLWVDEIRKLAVRKKGHLTP